ARGRARACSPWPPLCVGAAPAPPGDLSGAADPSSVGTALKDRGLHGTCPIQLFASPAGKEPYLYVGEIRLTSLWPRALGDPEVATFDLYPKLPKEAWVALG